MVDMEIKDTRTQLINYISQADSYEVDLIAQELTSNALNTYAKYINGQLTYGEGILSKHYILKTQKERIEQFGSEIANEIIAEMEAYANAEIHS